MEGKDRVAVVTGSNKGIGYAIVEKLSEVFDGTVILTARDEELGKAALNSILVKQTGQKATLEFHQLDIVDKSSIERLRDYLVEKFGGLDLLINNAGIAFKGSSTAPFSERAEVTIRTNYLGTLDVCQILFPILREHARVVNVSSGLSEMKGRYSDEWRQKFGAEDLTIDKLAEYTNQFIQAAKDDKVEENGWRKNAYGVSKASVNSLTKIQAREMKKDSRKDILVNCCCPGWVDTDMTSHSGPLTPAQGAETPMFLAMLPAGSQSPNGEFFQKKTVVEWP